MHELHQASPFPRHHPLPVPIEKSSCFKVKPSRVCVCVIVHVCARKDAFSKKDNRDTINDQNELQKLDAGSSFVAECLSLFFWNL